MLKTFGTHNYFVYILTNKSKTVLYTEVTNDIENRLLEHEESIKENKQNFTARYKCKYLLYWERHQNVKDAIEREKEIKGWRREKKENLINELNPNWNFLNDEIRE